MSRCKATDIPLRIYRKSSREDNSKPAVEDISAMGFQRLNLTAFSRFDARLQKLAFGTAAFTT